MKIDPKLEELLKPFNDECDAVCARHAIDRQMLDEFMRFANFFYALTCFIARINKEGSSNRLLLQAGSMAFQAWNLFWHMHNRLFQEQGLNKEQFLNLLDALNDELELYPAHYRAAKFPHILALYCKAQCNIFHELRQGSSYDAITNLIQTLTNNR